MDLLTGLITHDGPYWIPGTVIMAVVALVVFYARGGRRAHNERARKRMNTVGGVGRDAKRIASGRDG